MSDGRPAKVVDVAIEQRRVFKTSRCSVCAFLQRTATALALIVFCAGLTACAGGLAHLQHGVAGPMYGHADRLDRALGDLTPYASRIDRINELGESLRRMGLEGQRWLAAERIGGVSDFADVVGVPDRRDGAYRVVFLIEGEWNNERVDRFIAMYYALPGQSIEGLPVVCHVWSEGEVPAAIKYRFSPHWASALEASIYVALAAPAQPHEAEAFVERAREQLRVTGVTLNGKPEHVVTELDAILARLPRVGDEQPQPTATLIAIALVLGDAIRLETETLNWVDGAAHLAQYFALVGERGDVYRPIDFVELAWTSALDHPLSRYAHLVRRTETRRR
ncbi:MAG: hypothetical protein ACI82G_002022 [Bradymonadia bacterium]